MRPRRMTASEAVRNPAVVFSALFLLVLVASAILLALTGFLDPYATNASARNLPPGTVVDGATHLLGTDPLGRDVLARLVLGSQVSLTVGIASVIVSGLIGVTLGIIAGYYKGATDDIVMRLVDLQQSVPSLLIALLVLYVAGPSFANVIIVLAITRWMVYARVARSLVLTIRQEPFVEAARALGASDARIMLRHIVPNIAGPITVLATLELGVMLLTEAALSFLGLGVQPPASSWGLMLAEGREYITGAWWLVALPGFAILLTVLSINIIASWARSRTDDNKAAAIAAASKRMFRAEKAGAR